MTKNLLEDIQDYYSMEWNAVEQEWKSANKVRGNPQLTGKTARVAKKCLELAEEVDCNSWSFYFEFDKDKWTINNVFGWDRPTISDFAWVDYKDLPTK